MSECMGPLPQACLFILEDTQGNKKGQIIHKLMFTFIDQKPSKEKKQTNKILTLEPVSFEKVIRNKNTL